MNGITTNNSQVKTVILVMEPHVFYLGDNCMVVSHLRSIKAFFENSTIDINYNFSEFEDLLKNNPFVNSIACRPWNDIKFEDYDAIFIMHQDERVFHEFISGKYGERAVEEFYPKIYSLSTFLQGCKAAFPVLEPLNLFLDNEAEKRKFIHELFVTGDETAWGDKWLETAGVGEEDRVVVLIDETTSRKKLLKTDVYFNVVNHFLERPNIKLLILDKNDLGKEAVYEAWLGQEKAKRLVFGKGLLLRHALSILSSKYIKVVFGPCTGLLHCAAAIAGHRIKNGVDMRDIPLLFVYTGKYLADKGNASTWWGKAPVECLILKRTEDGRKEIKLLHNLDKTSLLDEPNILGCSEYETAPMIDFLSQYSERFQHLFETSKVAAWDH